MDSSQKSVTPTLLLADDSVTIQKVIELTFADQGVRVIAVGDGDSAIALVEQTPPDIVLADVGMPGKSGYEVSLHIKQSPRLAHIPVLLLTGAFDPLDQARAREAGCDGVLEKPFEPQEVISRVRELMGHSSAGAAFAAGIAAGEVMPAGASSSPNGGAAPATPSPAGGAVKPPAANPAGPGDQTMPGVSWPAEVPSGDVSDRTVVPNGPASAAGASAAPVAQTPAGSSSAVVTLADAFAALLAAEQQGMAASESPGPMLQPAGALTDDMIEQVAERVLERLSTQVVRETVSEIVSGIAERLVLEEIERIKASIK